MSVLSIIGALVLIVLVALLAIIPLYRNRFPPLRKPRNPLHEEFFILEALQEHSPLSAGELFLQMDKRSAPIGYHARLASLVQRGWVQELVRLEDEYNGQTSRYELTALGEREYARLRSQFENEI